MADARMGFGTRKRKRSNGGRRSKKVRRAPARLGAKGELKFLDTVKALTDLATTGVLLDDSVNHVVQDTSENGRIGRKIVVSSIHLRAAYVLPETVTAAQMDQYLRVIVFVDHQANGTAATMADIVSTAGTVDIDSFRNLSNVGRFHILLDKVFSPHVNAIGQTAAGAFTSIPRINAFLFNKRVNIPIEFDSSAADGSMGTITSNNIGVMAICFSGAVLPKVGYTCRIRFRDG